MGNWMAAKGGRSTYLVGKGGGPTRLKVQPGNPISVTTRDDGGPELRAFRDDVTLMTQAMQLVDPDERRCQGGTRRGDGCSEFRGLFHTLRGPRCYRHLGEVHAFVVIIVPDRLSSGVLGGIHFGEAWTIWMDQERLLREGYTSNRKVAADRARGMAIRKLRTWQRRNYKARYRHVVWAI